MTSPPSLLWGLLIGQDDPILFPLHPLLGTTPHMLWYPEGAFVFPEEPALGVVGKVAAADVQGTAASKSCLLPLGPQHLAHRANVQHMIGERWAGLFSPSPLTVAQGLFRRAHLLECDVLAMEKADRQQGRVQKRGEREARLVDRGGVLRRVLQADQVEVLVDHPHWFIFPQRRPVLIGLDLT